MDVRSWHRLLFSLLVFYPFCTQGQSVKFEKIDTDKGLSHSTVLCMTQDSRKFLWFGTKDGLNRYDFNACTVYRNNPENKNSLSHNCIKAIQADTAGNLWIATWGGGLNFFDSKKERFTQFRHNKADSRSIASDFINCLYKDSQGNLWIGTDNAGLDLWDARRQTFVHFVTDPGKPTSLSDNCVKTIREDSQHRLWVGTANGVNQFHPATRSFTAFLHTASPNSVSHNTITFLYEDHRQKMWVGTYGGGLNLWNDASRTFTRYNTDTKTLPGNHLLCMMEDATGQLLIGTENKGLVQFDPTRLTYTQYVHHEADSYSLSNNTINCIGKDDKSNIWIGTLNGGVCIINKEAENFVHYRHSTHPNSLSNNNVISLYEDSDAQLWVGTDGGGLNRLNKNTRDFVHYTHIPGNTNSIAGNFVRALYEDREKNLWIGTWGEGVTVWNRARNTFTHFRHNPADEYSLSSNNIWAILEDSKGTIWIGTYDAGLNLFDKTTRRFRRFQHHSHDPHSLSSNQILSLYEDRARNLWIGTDDGGLNLLDRQRMTFSSFKHGDDRNSLSNNTVGCILEDTRGNLWLGTNLGLNQLDKHRTKFRRYFVKNGLPNDVILGILEDANGHLWVSTNNGLCQLDPVRGTFKVFTVADGLQGTEFKENAYAKGKNGQLYFGGKNGFNAFFPENVKPSPYEPSVVLTRFEIFNQPVRVTDRATAASPLTASITHTKDITVSYKQSVLSFGFAVLHHTSPEKKQYSYLLEGFDKAWHVMKNGNSVTYTNLDPGTYVLRVKGLNNEGKWSSKEAVLRLTVTPPFWRTWWFKGLLLALGMTSFMAYHTLKTRMIKRRNKILEMHVRERTEEIRQKSAEIEHMNELLAADNKRLETNVEDIARARVMQKKLSFEEFKQIFPDDDSCLRHLTELKWKDGFVCRKCNNTTFAPWKSSHTKRCSKCRYIESATAFTIFHSVKFSVLKAFYMLFLIHTKPAITAEELAQTVELSTKTSMVFKRKIRKLLVLKKGKKKTVQWDDLILLETDDQGIIRKV